jgi:hypothetical protein
VLGAIELVGCFQQVPLFVRSDSTIALRLGLGFDLDAESMEGRCDEDRRGATATPIDRVPKDAERSIDCSDRSGFAVLALEIFDRFRPLQRADR